MKKKEPCSSQWFSLLGQEATFTNHMKFHLKMRRHFFTVRVVKQWNRSCREVVESSSVGIFKN